MSKQKERFEAMRAEATKKILFSATKLFAQKTFFKTTMQDIADDAGVSKGLAYRYFSSKEEIMNHLIELSVPGFDSLSTLLHQDRDEKELLSEVTGFLLENLKHDSSTSEAFQILSQIDSFSENELSSEVRAGYEKSLQNLIANFARVIKSGQEKGYFTEGNPEHLALFYYSTYQGVAFSSRTFKEKYVYPTVDVFLKFLIKV
ncbi:TetR/AcrR family transcriptional regulator [Shimazuella sp. AN120528]|uniref:TetR/AcrR family transcriptional regulator n=1 Tax=Shimazuella soli TaxID=1892854 RepID=UPI001F0E5037|nr:TetR/AcrR family transcriptional regulator [Shimazuella soli]MCH5586091.1 TetR/AcrR family transcriptional regulator [Shimazuella soli]